MRLLWEENHYGASDRPGRSAQNLSPHIITRPSPWRGHPLRGQLVFPRWQGGGRLQPMPRPIEKPLYRLLRFRTCRLVAMSLGSALKGTFHL